MVELRVEDDGQTVLVYALRSVREASDMMLFLRDFLPEATFIVQPLRH